MNCRDFERLWNELIDAGSRSPADDHSRTDTERETALFQHAATCPACRRSAAGYQALQRAILAWGKAPEPSHGLTDRILAAVDAPPRASRLTARLSRTRALQSMVDRGRCVNRGTSGSGNHHFESECQLRARPRSPG